jgi:ankyrin repeat protein
LLERGADPNYRGCGANALASAAAGGNITIVRKILNHGVDISGTKLDEPIRRAIRIEHTAIVRLLLKLTPDLSFGGRRYLYLLNVAAKEGLDSMVELLEREVPRAQTLELEHSRFQTVRDFLTSCIFTSQIY